ncbi:radical SAM protein [Youngiibacter fragilis]|uniref:Iron-sulfur protein n=1 Tax=Youngiibacter fragilis 232.1 TaxID=994573 RepID=V7I6F9_9CLOT|nr:radical SAM protein [Youngiibacter fragilis]ETA80789.1 iron-sulfur protein [Youngiibacter fragilis 232.1]
MVCSSCPRNCGIDRNKVTGFCGTTREYKLAKAYLHPYEEPMISGKRGSGTVFFSGCSLRCIFCQNHEISEGLQGTCISDDRLLEIFFELRDKGAENINLVTPTHYASFLPDVLRKAKANGLDIPIVYNSSGYEDVEALKGLEGLIDVYLPDLKYFRDIHAKEYSGVRNYFSTAKAAIAEMYRQTGPFILDERGIMVKGMIVRHLCLPSLALDSKLVLKHLYETYGDNIYMSIMNQYVPMHRAIGHEKLGTRLSASQYRSVVSYAASLGTRNCLIQDSESQSDSFTPDFDLHGVK